jgi:hypothetical protein
VIIMTCEMEEENMVIITCEVWINFITHMCVGWKLDIFVYFFFTKANCSIMHCERK